MQFVKRSKIYLLGSENVDWSIDRDRKFIEKTLQELNYKIVKNIFVADIIYCVWWNYLNDRKMKLLKLFFPNKRIIATITNDPTNQIGKFNRLRKIVDYWVCANEKQKKFLIEHDISNSKIFKNHYYFDEKIFKKEKISKLKISEELGIDYDLIKNNLVIGSFQRDSLGSNLRKPKWQKNPDLLIDIMRNLSEKHLLLLAGPRRHYLINKCEEFKIQYLFVGNKKYVQYNKDDMKTNILDSNKINLLYNLTDIYLMTSASEGGPKSVIEAPLTKTLVLSTDVGITSEMLDEESVCKTKREFVKKITSMTKSKQRKLIEKNYDKVIKINNHEKMKERIEYIITNARR